MSSRKSDSGGDSAGKLSKLRADIDKFDQQLLETLNKRAAVAAQIGKVKADAGGEVFNAAREEEVLNAILKAHKGPLPEVTVKAIFRELISGSRALQSVQRVAFLGPDYSYSHLAAIERFGQSAEYSQVGSIQAVFDEVLRKHANFGVVPLENSTDGRIADTLDCFIRNPQVKICAEIRLRVHHHLLANCQPAEVRKVYSKAQALSQCRHWLSKNMPQATAHPVNSTADAARLVQGDPFAAAVASRQAGVRYGLKTLFASIEDHPENETRFAVIALNDSNKTGHDKTALIFQVQHTPGALVDALLLFKANKINLTWVESFPYKEAKGEYVFFVDFEGHQDEPKVKKAIKALEEMCESVSVLGSYPVSVASDE
ncbi:MAG: prephenate dehydratase [Fimbriiglobus sp.]|jgi:chorismate mutase/prephenate dehydratase|nr:prephenate dehydratase [Fimbriiglobus sp.]